MPLPVISAIHQPGSSDLVRLFHRLRARWVEHLGTPAQLDAGIAYSNPELPNVWDANHLSEAALRGDLTPQQVFDEVAAHFRAAGTHCAYWVLSPSAGPEQGEPLAAFLKQRGYSRLSDDIMYLHHVPSSHVPPTAELKIIPARASYRHARALAVQVVEECWGGLPQLVEARLAHLDDPHWDALLALDGDQVVAGIGVLVVGELGLIEHVYVSPSHRRRGIARTMMSRALEICARSQLRHVFLMVAGDNTPAISLYRQLGFDKIGEVERYRATKSAEC